MADQIGTGFELYVETAQASGIYVLQGDVMSAQPPENSRDEIEVTDITETTRRFIPGLHTNGTMSCTIAYDASVAEQAEWEAEIKNSVTASGKRLAIYHEGMDRHWILTGFATRFQANSFERGAHVTAAFSWRCNSISAPAAGRPPTS